MEPKGSNKAWWWVVGIVVVIVVVYLVTQNGGGSNQASGPVKIGFIGPLTGDAASIGENALAAVQLARDEINAAGGVGGQQVEIIAEDGKCGPTDAANAANKLVNVDHVVAIVGGLCSSETLAAAPIAEAGRVPMISYGSTNPKVTQAGDYIFRFVPSDLMQGKFAAEYMYTTLGHKKVAILYCLSDWCVGLKDVFKARLAELGGTLVDEEGYEQDVKDVRSQLTKIKAAKPDAVYFLGYTEGSIVGLKQMKELGLSAPVLGGDAWDDAKIPAEAGSAADGARYTLAASQKLPQAFIDAIAQRVSGRQLDTYTPRAYDIMQVLVGIIGQQGTDAAKIKDALYAVSEYQGIGDRYTMDANGDDTVANFTVKEFRNGKLQDLSSQ